MTEDRKRKGARFGLTLFIITIILSVAPTIFAGHFFINRARTKEVEQFMREAKSQVLVFANRIQESDYIALPHNPTVNDLIQQIANVWNARVQILDGSCRIVKDTYNVDAQKFNTSEQVIECLSAKNTITKADTDTMIAIIAHPVTTQQENGGEQTVMGIILISADLNKVVAGIDSVRENVPFIGIIYIVVLLIIVRIVTLFLARPFRKLAVAVDAAADGSLKGKVEVRSYRVTSRVSDAVNRMLSVRRMMDDSRQEFVSDVAHELKTPITSARVLAESLLAMDEVPNELYREFMEDITEEINRESAIIDDLLNMVKLDRGVAKLNIVKTNINEWLELSLKRLMPLAHASDVDLSYESFRPVIADVDEVKLTLAITNLVENAIKYNHKNGWVRVSLNADMKYFYIKVADSGCGIPKDSLEHVFERFYRVDKDRARATGGTGLGLSITKTIVNLHNGAVRVYSEINEGSTFVIRIPLVHTAEEEK